MQADEDFLFPNEPGRFGHRELNDLLQFCTEKKASDIYFTTGARVSAKFHGKFRKVTLRAMSNAEIGSILDFMYGPNGTTKLSTDGDLDTRYDIPCDRFTRYYYRVNATACVIEGANGISIVMRTIPGAPPALESLNLEAEILENMTPHQGLILIAGSTGSGKSTLMAAVLAHLKSDPNGNRFMVSYESPIEFVFDSIVGVTSELVQTEVPRQIPTFEAAVRNSLRRAPNLINVGETRDVPTASVVMEAVNTGHPVYTTVHTNGVAKTIDRMVNLFPADERAVRVNDLLDALHMVIWQKLVPAVDGTRVALREYLVFTESIKSSLRRVPSEQISHEIRRILVAKNQTVYIDAERKFAEGRISESVLDSLKSRDKGEKMDFGG